MLHRLAFLFLPVLLAPAVHAQEPPETLDLHPAYVAMFKNGLGLVVGRTEVPGEGPYQIAPLPQAMLGSLWLSWTPGIVLHDVRSAYAEHTEAVQAASVADILRANVGRTLQLKLSDREDWLTATIVSVPDTPQAPPTPSQPLPLFPDPSSRHGDLLVLRINNGMMALSPGRVTAVHLNDGILNDSVSRTTMVPTVRFSASGGRGRNRALEMSYIAQGIAWSPSYVVGIDDDDQARFSAKAVIANDLIDLDGTRVELIAGYPHLPFAEALSALSLEPLATILNRIRAAGQGSTFSNEEAVLRQRVAYDEVGGVSGPTMPTTPVAGESVEDLYFYELPDVTLRRGERGYFPLFTDDVPYTDLYTWDIPDFVDQYDRYQGQNALPEVVWHALKLTNTTAQPWTTAPAMTMKNGRVLGQATLSFTPPEGTSRLPITQAVSIKAEQNELEVERRRDAARFHNTSYDEVIVEGTLSLTNYKTEDVTVEITKTLSGEVTSAEGEPATVRLAKGMQRVNPRSRLTWTVNVPAAPDQPATLHYRYTFYTQ